MEMNGTNTMVQKLEKAAVKGLDAYLQKFEKFEREAAQPSWVFPLRKAGMARFAELGFPTLKDEDWRFTNMAPVAKLPFKPVLESAQNGVSSETLTKMTFGALEATRLVFINGHYVQGLSSARRPQDGVKVKNLASALAEDSELLEAHLGRYA